MGKNVAKKSRRTEYQRVDTESGQCCAYNVHKYDLVGNWRRCRLPVPITSVFTSHRLKHTSRPLKQLDYKERTCCAGRSYVMRQKRQHASAPHLCKVLTGRLFPLFIPRALVYRFIVCDFLPVLLTIFCLLVSIFVGYLFRRPFVRRCSMFRVSVTIEMYGRYVCSRPGCSRVRNKAAPRWHLILRHSAFDTLGIVSRGAHKTTNEIIIITAIMHIPSDRQKMHASWKISCHTNQTLWPPEKMARSLIWQLGKWDEIRLYLHCVRISCVALLDCSLHSPARGVRHLVPLRVSYARSARMHQI